MTVYIDIESIFALHADLIHRFGGVAGIRDRELLEAALARPQTGYYHDVIAEAAALWESLSQNHPFLDGNKRIAFAATDVFLRLNGFIVGADQADTYRFMIGLYQTNAFRFDELDAWLRKNVRRAI